MIARTKINLDRDFVKRDVIAQEVQNKPLPTQIDELGIIAEKTSVGGWTATWVV